eukprot:3031599-Rhodomonas_salina.1
MEKSRISDNSVSPVPLLIYNTCRAFTCMRLLHYSNFLAMLHYYPAVDNNVTSVPAIDAA